jgi:hypothetical protein
MELYPIENSRKPEKLVVGIKKEKSIFFLRRRRFAQHGGHEGG